MKKVLMASLLGLVLAGFTGCNFDPKKWGESTITQRTVQSSGTNVVDITIINNTTVAINEIYVTSTSNASWGSSLGSVAASASVSKSLGSLTCSEGKVDLIVQFSDTKYTVKYDQALSCGSTYDWTITGQGTDRP